MHKHEFMFTYEGNAVCTDPTCAYRFSLKEVKEILSNIANGESAQHSVQSDKCPHCQYGLIVLPDKNIIDCIACAGTGICR